MANAVVTPRMRAYGWNIHLLAGTQGDHFAGLYHPPGSDSLSYRDVINELRLCFEISPQASGINEESSDSWCDVAFAHAGYLNVGLPPSGEDAPNSALICGEDLDQPVSAPRGSADLEQRPITRFHVVRHTACDLAPAEPLAAHLRAGCARYIPYPSLRRDDRYLPPHKASKDPTFALFPYRRTLRSTRSSRSPSKRSASGSISPSKDSQHSMQDAGGDEDIANLVAPPTLDVSTEIARRTMAAFRTSCLVGSAKCAVTGRGRSWCVNPTVGPAIQACHIVSQLHYHVFPVAMPFVDESKYSHRRLREAWERTWSVDNGILLLKHLHELFDARLFSIHPDTLQVRVFVPYDVISEYHGTIANIPVDVDRKALRHHYEMCCMENMAAKMPLREQYAPSEMTTRSANSGTASPLGWPNVPTILSANSSGNTNLPKVGDSHGDPSKRTRPTDDDRHGSNQLVHELALPNLMPCHWYYESDSPDHEALTEDENSFGEGEATFGRKKRLQPRGREESPWVCDDWDGCMTHRNSRKVLADLDWELEDLRDHMED